MKSVKLKIIGADAAWITALAGGQLNFDTSNETANLSPLPHLGNSRELAASEILILMAQFSGNVAAGIIASHLYDELKSRRLRQIQIAGKTCETKEAIEEALIEEQESE